MKNPFKVFSFHYTFFFTFLFFSLFFILLIGVASYAISNQETVKQTIQTRKLLLSEINKQLAAQMQAIEYDSLAISSSPKLVNYLQNAGESYDRIQLKRDILDQISRLSYIKDGIHSVQLFSASIDRPEGLGTNGLFNAGIIQGYDWYDQIENADSCWVGAHDANTGYIESGDNLVVSFARKIISLSGKEVGILVINMKLSYMNQIIANNTPGDSRYILDSYNRLITEVAGSETGSFAMNNAGNRISNILDEPHQEEYAVSRNDRKMLLIWNKQTSSNWVLMDAIDWDNVTIASRQIKNVILLAALCCIVLAIVAALLLAYQFVQPIRKLIHVVGQIKSGKLDVQIKNDYQNEFGKLNEHVNLMVGRIRQLLLEVDDQNRRKREAELQMLQEQINPHFIYNTLDTINWQAIEHGAHSISKMLSLLGKMLRLGLSKGSAFISIRSEMEYLQCYIELQMIRYQHEISITLTVPESTHPFLVPKLMLQPFIENALIHGMEGGKGGEISIVVSEDDKDLYFTIADTGKGMDSEGQYGSGKMKGSGIRNVRERIQLYFGGNYGMKILSNPGMGTMVTINIPKVSPEYPENGEGNRC